jgi:hypothetical protein
MKKDSKSRDQLVSELRNEYERGASIRSLVASTGHSYGSIHSMLRESGAAMRSRGGPNHRGRRGRAIAGGPTSRQGPAPH